MPFLASILIRLGLGPKIAAALSWAALAAILGLALWWLRADAYSDGINAMKRELVEANVRFLKEKARADSAAADRRIADTVAVNKTESELINAIETVPDSAPDAVRIKLGCEQLRRSGVDTTRLPACRGS